MRGRRMAFPTNAKWKFRQLRIPLKTVLFVFIGTNFIALVIMSATTSPEYQYPIAADLTTSTPCVEYHNPRSVKSTNDLKPNITDEERDVNISVKEIQQILEHLQDKNGNVRRSHILEFLLQKNVTSNKRWLSSFQSVRTTTYTPNSLYKNHMFPLSVTNVSRSSHPSGDTSSSNSNHHLNESATNAQKELHIKENAINLRLPKQEQNTSIWRESSNKFENRPSSLELIIEIQHKEHEHNNSTLSSSTKKFEVLTSSPRSIIEIQQMSNMTHFEELKSRVVSLTTKSLPSCIENTKDLAHKLSPVMHARKPKELAAMFPILEWGGHYTPKECQPKEKTAIIIPYRNRYQHLLILLQNILPLLIKQKVEFTVFVVEQVLPGAFNRGMLFNVGFLEAIKRDNFSCFIFHDVDLVPINELNFYHCNQHPTHFITGVDKFKYKLMYQNMFGGVVAFTRQQFKDVNGASNLYFGWGGEDDDLQRRVMNKGYHVTRKYSSIGLYDMIRHKRDDTNLANPFRGQMLKSAEERQNIEGLNTTLYTTLSVELLPLYTWVKVRINITEVLMTAPAFMDKIRDTLLTHFLGGKKSVAAI